MINISICDDDPASRELLRRELSDYMRGASPEGFTLCERSSPDELLSSLDTALSDIYILDILMPRMNGIELGRTIRRRDPDGVIIYLTSSPEYALSSYEVEAFYYLLKPADAGRLRPVMDRALEHIGHRRHDGTVVKTRSSEVFVPFSELLYAELDSRAVRYRMANGAELRSTTLREPFRDACAELTRDRRFVLCGTSWCVNLSLVSAVGSGGITFRNGLKLNLSKRALADIHTPWLDYWLED